MLGHCVRFYITKGQRRRIKSKCIWCGDNGLATIFLYISTTLIDYIFILYSKAGKANNTC